MNRARTPAARIEASYTSSASALSRCACRRSAPNPFTTRTPDTVSSTTVESSPSSCCNVMTSGWMREEKTLAATLSNGSAPSASSASPAFVTSRMTATESTVSPLAIARGMNTRKNWICWRSPVARAMTWPVWDASWNAKCSRCRWAKSRPRRSVSMRAATPMAR